MASCTGGSSSPVPLDKARIDQLAQELYKCVKKDHLVKARFIMKGLSKSDKKRIVSRQINGNAPLVVAAQLGHLHFVNYLLDECGADIEQRGIYEVQEDHSKHLVTPLWCSAVANKCEVVKTLVRHGANVNATSDTQSTPVRSACYMTNVEIVRYLVENGADIHRPNINGGTCLINSVQSVELCEFLIDKGADVNAQDNSGNLAMHYAVREGRTDTVKLLLKNHSNPFIVNDFGDDSLQTAALRGFKDILDYLLENVEFTKERKVEVYELIGCNYVDEKHDIPRALEIWREAMEMRFSDPDAVLVKPSRDPNPAYLNITEATSMTDLQELSGNPEAVHMQALLIRERIVGPDHKDVIFGLMYRGAVYADTHRYQRCVDLWKYAFKVRHERQEPLSSECVFTLQALCKLFWEIQEESRARYTDEKVSFRDTFEIFEMIIDEVSFAKDIIWVRPTYPPLQDEFAVLVKLVLHLMNLICVLDKNAEEDLKFRCLVHRLVKMDIKVFDDRSLIHLSVDSKTSMVLEEFYSPFPSISVIKLLVECGCQLDVTDSGLNTPLHTLVEGYNAALRDTEEIPQFEDVALYLVSKGAHIDARNAKGKIISKSLVKLFPRISVAQHITLKCLAARAIKDNDIPYKGEVPTSLLPYIGIH